MEIKVFHRVEEGRPAQDGDRVQIHYVLELDNGTVVDSSHGKRPLDFLLGRKRNVIDGMHPAVRGMRIGDRRTVRIPPKLGYGDRTMGAIPKKSTLIFHIEMVGVYPG